MTRETNRRNSIYTQLLRLLLVASFSALVVFLLLDFATKYFIRNNFEETDYIEKKNQDYVEKLQEFIKEEELETTDTDKINLWVKSQKLIFVQIYKDDILVFNSEYPTQDVLEEEIAAGNYSWESYYMVEFADGSADVIITGAYTYQLYSYSMIAEMIVSFLFFLAFVLLGIRRKMDYIRKLSDEIEILEGGSLDYKITVKGKDEISALAEGLDSMRLSFGRLIRQEAEMVRENQRIVTEMSHDLRTPITSIMLYTEILKKEKNKNSEQVREYLDKIDEKAYRMKQLADHLIEYSLIAGEKEIELEEPEQFEILFYDLFSEICSYLEQKGFQVLIHVQWFDSCHRVFTDYIIRIMENVTSNIVKYADPSVPVEIFSEEEGNMTGFRFENAIRLLNDKEESTGIGIQNIKNMMKKMKGNCIVEEDGKKFCLILMFPKSDKQTSGE